MIELSVIIPTFNRREILERSLRLYNAQIQGAGRFEIIVAIDGSTDGTMAMLQQLKPALLYPLKVLETSGNRGASVARNLAIGEAQGEVVLIVGDDILPHERLIESHLDWHHGQLRSTEAGILGRVHWPREFVLTPFLQWLELNGEQFAYGRMKHGEKIPIEFMYTCNVSLKRRFLQTTGERFNERLRFFEDSELGTRLAKSGFELYYHEQAIGWHHHPTSLATSLRRMESVSDGCWQLRKEDPELFHRVTGHGLDPRRPLRRRALALALHPLLARIAYLPLARFCEHRIFADRLFALCHASQLLKVLKQRETQP